ncbi:MAG: hypothetical protein U5L09_21015 [Bacteroidales bacterium]|nr:hypothetical protein [Bacteroidales bacterium]
MPARGGISPITSRRWDKALIVKARAADPVGIRSTYSDWVLKQVDDLEGKKQQRIPLPTPSPTSLLR